MLEEAIASCYVCFVLKLNSDGVLMSNANSNVGLGIPQGCHYNHIHIFPNQSLCCSLLSSQHAVSMANASPLSREAAPEAVSRPR